MRLISWNVRSGGGRRRRPEQLAALGTRGPDIVCLQELTAKSASAYVHGLGELGLKNVVHSFDLFPGVRLRRYGQLIASRYPLNAMPVCGGEASRRNFVHADGGVLCSKTQGCPEAMISAIVESPVGAVEVHNCHIPPGSSNGWLKIDAFQMIYERLACSSENARILCGDFNSPQAELSDGTTITWGQRIRKDGSIYVARSIRGGIGADWDAGERSVLTGLAAFDLTDVYRKLNGWGAAEHSFVLTRKAGDVKRRFDHIFASEVLRATQCRYLHEYLEAGLSDHAPMQVDLNCRRAMAAKSLHDGEADIAAAT